MFASFPGVGSILHLCAQTVLEFTSNQTETSSLRCFWSGCFGLHPGVIAVFSPTETNHTKVENAPLA